MYSDASFAPLTLDIDPAVLFVTLRNLLAHSNHIAQLELWVTGEIATHHCGLVKR